MILIICSADPLENHLKYKYLLLLVVLFSDAKIGWHWEGFSSVELREETPCSDEWCLVVMIYEDDGGGGDDDGGGREDDGGGREDGDEDSDYGGESLVIFILSKVR